MKITGVCNYDEDATFLACESDLKTPITRPEHEVTLDIEWYESNYVKLNQDKCYYPTAGHKHETSFANVGKGKIWESQE